MAKTQIDDELVRRLAALLNETNLTEIEYEVGGLRLRVARSAAPIAAQVGIAAPAIAAAAPKTVGSDSAKADSGAINSPMVGVAYRGAEPGAKPYVAEGDQVAEGETLLLIEAMKTFNPIMAPRAGRVVRFLVGDGQPVEYGEPLLILA
jgi:acetyl-CoA carboxylase biotin carboxyl carrier protein